jgi:hypothetical protein
MHSGVIHCSGRGCACGGKHGGTNAHSARPGNAQPLNKNLTSTIFSVCTICPTNWTVLCHFSEKNYYPNTASNQCTCRAYLYNYKCDRPLHHLTLSYSITPLNNIWLADNNEKACPPPLCTFTLPCFPLHAHPLLLWWMTLLCIYLLMWTHPHQFQLHILSQVLCPHPHSCVLAFFCCFTWTHICAFFCPQSRACICANLLQAHFLGWNSAQKCMHVHLFILPPGPFTTWLCNTNSLVTHALGTLCLFYLYSIYFSKIILFYWVWNSDSCLSAQSNGPL